ncbi:tRNA (guanine-N(7)-)-methyltransferase non-catalytic subunit WDR4 [Solea senegalensis]|uniref:tRNA (Guanine-N(7)-)-methyltransferase non-catalytic subunit WDR4 n=1 Tax=Solea senegalensis TaxID=28829 RepID=A0AAV6RCW2_SOLSE|nr:tRNA (guanine-N(7)-)-methyltransferase non-catalytic subunit wdr4 [Solea senegalensis]KAG7503183.1 tRNA (guanine-N(7)-)-methyltransferase non-catalytic subunit WDR4 [Solea senegalensis]
MAAFGFCGDWCLLVCDKKIVAVHSKQSRDPYVFDCSTVEKKPKNKTNENRSNDDGASEDTGSDKVLAFAVSPSGKLVALTDDTKRLILLHCGDASWQCISIRFVVRRCTALVFSQAEDELLVADKSGDVYSFSVVEPQREGELKMGHLSMLLAITMSPDDKYIVTADRDEKIRVSHFRCPYNIQSFCLGHQEFVSALLIPSAHSHYLLSGSGDGTVKLWDFESGRRLQSCDLKHLVEKLSSEADEEKKPTVSHITSSPDQYHVAVLCERLPTVQIFTLNLESKEKLVPHTRLTLPHCPLDMTFDLEGRLWVLMDSSDKMLQMYSQRHGSWECDAESQDLMTVTEAFQPHWKTLEANTRTNSRFEHLVKRSYDNVEAYLHKKQQRLDEQQLKRTKTHKVNDNKKARKEMSRDVTQSST